MISFDTNIMFHASVPDSPRFSAARAWLTDLARQEIVVCDLALAEYYCLLRNPTVMKRAADPPTAAAAVLKFRSNPHWRVVQCAPVMERAWQKAAEASFPRRRLYDVRLAYTLQHHGVRQFATVNVKDFEDLGFERVWDPSG